jgi:uncharacterized protein (TIGR03437 family)
MAAIFRHLFGALVFWIAVPAGLAQTTAFPFKPVAFEYSKKLDRLILISTNPNRLHIYDPATSQISSVTLVQPPLSLSISPDGLRAAVGHDALITYVDLENAAVLKTFNVPTVANGIIAASSWIYTVGSYYATPYSVNIATGEAVKNTAAFSMTSGKLNPAVNAIYGTRDGTSPNDVEKWNISTGPVTAETDSPYHGDYCIYGPVWFSPDWNRIYTGCGTIFRASADPKLDMYYMSSLSGVNQIGSLDESAALQKIALLRRQSSYNTGQVDDSIVELFESPYLLPAGKFTLSGFDAFGKIYTPHGRAVFFRADSTELIVVKQADASSGFLNDYAVQRIPLSPSGECGATFASNSISVPAEGATGSVQINAPGTCVYQAASLAPWITIVSGGFGSGSGTVRWAVSANPDSVARSGAIVLPGQIFTISQAAASSSSPSALYIPGYYAVDAAYAKPIDRLVLVSANPNQLHIVDPAGRQDTVVPLNAPPLSLSVRPDGAQAAVGHDGWVTLVNLNTASVIKTISVPTDVHSLILAGNGYAYLFPLQEWGDLFSLELDSERISRTSAIYNGREPRLHVDGKHIYVGGQSQSKWDISGGVAKVVNSWPNSGGCGKLWLTEDGRRFFGDCAKAYTTSDVPSQDYQYNGSLPNATRLVWLDESAMAATIAAIPSAGPSYNGSAKPLDDTQVQLYGDAYLAYLGAIPLPKFIVGGTTFPAHGRYVFWNQSGTSLYAVVQADSKALLMGGTGITQLSISDAKQVTLKTVVNSASQAEGRIAPGEAISIYGSGMGPQSGASFTVDPVSGKVNSSLAGTEVYLNGVAAPVLYASETQVNAVVPFGVPQSGEVILQVGTQGILSPGVTLPVGPAAPGVFTMTGSGSGQAIGVNLDGTVCDSAHPAAPGSYVIVYFTGGGSTTPAGSTGSVAGSTLKKLSQTALATVADIPVTVSFAGAAPGLVEGVNQLNIKLDDKTPSGPAQPLILTVGNTSSRATATIAVK